MTNDVGRNSQTNDGNFRLCLLMSTFLPTSAQSTAHIPDHFQSYEHRRNDTEFRMRYLIRVRI